MSDVVEELQTLRSDAVAAVAAADGPDALREVEVRYLGRKARLNEILRGVRDLPDELKRVVGPAGNQLRGDLEAAVASRRAVIEAEAEARLLSSDRIDLSLPGRRPPRGAPNPLVETARRIEDAFLALGYMVAEGPEAETDWHNFQALNTPPAHPARSLMDTYYLKGPRGPESALLRTHTSPVQIRVMESQPPPIYVVCPGRVFRRDDTNPTHSPVFHQLEGLAVDEGITFAHLRWTIERFVSAAFGPDRRGRLVPSFYPFTEPSCELQVTCPLCEGDGCSQCASGWLGIGGAGMVDPNVFESCNIDPERFTGFAFGMSLERPPMDRHGINDIRLFSEGDLRFLERFRGMPVV